MVIDRTLCPKAPYGAIDLIYTDKRLSWPGEKRCNKWTTFSVPSSKLVEINSITDEALGRGD
jgi:hypothetical protein